MEMEISEVNSKQCTFYPDVCIVPQLKVSLRYRIQRLPMFAEPFSLAF